MSEITNGMNTPKEKFQPKTSAESRNEAIENDIKLLKSNPLIHNTLGLLPAEVTYVIPLDDLEKSIREIAKRYIDGIEYTTIEIEPSSGRPNAYVWLRRDSKHLIDRRADDPDMVFNPHIVQFSQALKDFADNFAPDKDEKGRFIDRSRRIQIKSPRGNNSNLVAIKIDLDKVLQRIFDINNLSFRDTYGKNDKSLVARPCKMRCKLIYKSDRKDGFDRRNCLGLRVTKLYQHSRFDRNDDRPVVDNFRDKSDDFFED